MSEKRNRQTELRIYVTVLVFWVEIKIMHQGMHSIYSTREAFQNTNLTKNEKQCFETELSKYGVRFSFDKN